MKKLKQWIYGSFVPDWCRVSLMHDNEALKRQISAKNAEIAQLNSYIDGLEQAMRLTRRTITIQGAKDV